jgi:hypothetical protein
MNEMVFASTLIPPSAKLPGQQQRRRRPSFSKMQGKEENIHCRFADAFAHYSSVVFKPVAQVNKLPEVHA